MKKKFEELKNISFPNDPSYNVNGFMALLFLIKSTAKNVHRNIYLVECRKYGDERVIIINETKNCVFKVLSENQISSNGKIEIQQTDIRK